MRFAPLRHAWMALAALQALVAASAPSAFPVDLRVPFPPRPVVALGAVHLLYEIHVTNFSALPAVLSSLDVLAEGSGTPLVRLQGADLARQAVPVGPGADGADPLALGGGRSLVLFLDLGLAPGTERPAGLWHRFALSLVPKEGPRRSQSVTGAWTRVVPDLGAELRPPVRGSGWVAFNGLSEPVHRRTLIPVDGKVRAPERFAIDWMRLGPDGRLYRGDPGTNANYYGFGEEVLAVADGRVAGCLDDLPDQQGANDEAARSRTLETVAGNHVVLDLGQGRFALYAHLQPGSLRVKAGDPVKAGQALALLGNSGNSDAPHLHFQVMDGPSPLGSEGLPYALAEFTQLGSVADPDSLDRGGDWHPDPKARPGKRRSEFPGNLAVVAFPGAKP